MIASEPVIGGLHGDVGRPSSLRMVQELGVHPAARRHGFRQCARHAARRPVLVRPWLETQTAEKLP